MPILEGLTEGLPTKPHPKASLAAKGHLVYDYSKRLAKEQSNTDSHSLSLKKVMPSAVCAQQKHTILKLS